MFAAGPSVMLCRPWPNRKTQLSWGDSEKVGLHAILAKSHSSQKSKKIYMLVGPILWTCGCSMNLSKLSFFEYCD